MMFGHSQLGDMTDNARPCVISENRFTLPADRSRPGFIAAGRNYLYIVVCLLQPSKTSHTLKSTYTGCLRTFNDR